MIEEALYTDVLKIRNSVMYPDKDITDVTLPDDDMGIHLGYYERGQLIGVVSLFLNNRALQFRKLAVIDEYQNKGYGSKIIQWILDYANEMKLEKVWCNARINKLSFYKKFGFIETENTFDKGDHSYVVMVKKILEDQ